MRYYSPTMIGMTDAANMPKYLFSHEYNKRGNFDFPRFQNYRGRSMCHYSHFGMRSIYMKHDGKNRSTSRLYYVDGLSAKTGRIHALARCARSVILRVAAFERWFVESYNCTTIERLRAKRATRRSLRQCNSFQVSCPLFGRTFGSRRNQKCVGLTYMPMLPR